MDFLEEIDQLSRKYVEENVQNPIPSDYLYAYNLMLKGFEVGMQTAAGVNATFARLDKALLDRLKK